MAKGFLKNHAHTLTKAMDEEIWPRLTDVMNVKPVGEPVDICMVEKKNSPKDVGGVRYPNNSAATACPPTSRFQRRRPSTTPR